MMMMMMKKNENENKCAAVCCEGNESRIKNQFGWSHTIGLINFFFWLV